MTKRRSPLFSQHQPGGVFNVVNLEYFPADMFFVDSGHAAASDAAGFGHNPDKPFATLDYAVGQCTENVGDYIFVMPGHAETITAAGGLDLDVAGITIVGIGNGSLIPTITLGGADTVDVDVDAANITVRHIKFVAGFADIVAAIDVNACNTTFIDCQFFGDGAGLNALIWIQDAAAGASDYITVKDCFFYDPDATNTHAINFAGTGFGHLVRGNRFYGDWGTLAVGGAGATVCSTIDNNYIWNIAAVNDSCINSAADGGWVVGNMVSSPQAQANAITAANIAKFNNYEAVDTEDLSGLLEPPVT
jgi:hypothetical protein